MIRLILSLVYNTLYLLLLPLVLLRRARAAPRGAWVFLRIDGPVVELGRKRRPWDRRPPPLSLYALGRALEEAAGDPRVSGLVVSIESLQAGAATSESLREVLQGFKASGKPLAVYLPRGGAAKEFYVASVADRLFLGTEAIAEPSGYAVTTPYVAGLLDEVGVEREVLARGRFKTMAEPAVREHMSDAQREQVGAYLDALHANLVEALSQGRGLEEAAVRALIDEGMFTAEEACARGLCDAVLHPDEVPTTLDPNREDGAVMVDVLRYASRRRVAFRPWVRRRLLAVLPLQGAIVEKSPTPMFPAAEERQVVELCRDLWSDDRVCGVVLAVNTGGGGALASERIRRALERLGKKKPLVAYLANIAASGGYLAAMAAPTLVARRTTLTGSIGVIAARLTTRPLMRKAKVSIEVEKRGARADMHSGARTLDEGERARMDAYVDASYEAFLKAVAQGRKLEVEQVRTLAEGRVWSGTDAHARGLVDEIGGLSRALAILRERVGSAAGRAVPRVFAPKHGEPGMLSLVSRLAGTRDAGDARRWLAQLFTRAPWLTLSWSAERALATTTWAPADAHAAIDA